MQHEKIKRKLGKRFNTSPPAPQKLPYKRVVFIWKALCFWSVFISC